MNTQLHTRGVWMAMITMMVTLAVAQNCPSTPCAASQCCSVHGYCGTSSDYCAAGNCAANCWTDGEGCKLGGSHACPSGQCCSQHGWCGTTPDHCSPANNCFSNCQTTPTTPTNPSSGYVFAGYMASWIAQRPAPCTLSVASIDVSKYTHLIVAFAGFNTNNFALSAMNGDDTSGWYSNVLGLKNRNPKLKVLIAVGGGGFGTGPFSTMVSSAANRQKFITECISFAHRYGFDGIDIDWEFPDASQSSNIQALFSAFHSAIVADSRGLLLTATSPNYQSGIAAFGFAQIQSYLDWINVMNYDYSGPWLNTLASDTGYNSVVSTFNAFPGVARNKLVMGFANYARGFTLLSPSQTAPGSAYKGPGSPGPCSRDPDGTLSYTEINSMLASSPAPTVAFDSPAQTPYFYRGNQWVTYDNAASVRTKLSYVTNNGLRGAMVWTVDADHSLTDVISASLRI